MLFNFPDKMQMSSIISLILRSRPNDLVKYVVVVGSGIYLYGFG